MRSAPGVTLFCGVLKLRSVVNKDCGEPQAKCVGNKETMCRSVAMGAGRVGWG